MLEPLGQVCWELKWRKVECGCGGGGSCLGGGATAAVTEPPRGEFITEIRVQLQISDKPVTQKA